jgi:PAS domain S-box-containing protein
VYAAEVDFFRKEETTLLLEAANDISYALDSLQREQERREAELLVRNERLFSETMIESTPGILYFCDETGRFLRWNRNFESVSGYSAEEIAQMHPLEFFSDEDRGLVAERIAAVYARGESSVEAPFRSKDGTTTLYFLTGRRIVTNGRACLVGVGIDISERKRAETALRELNENLEAKVAERTAELQVAVTRAESADRLKSAFLATMSHELRTPLNSIIGFTGIVLQGLAGPLNAEQHKQLGMVRSSARHLLELINDVLDLSKIEADQLEVHERPFDLPEVVRHAVDAIRPLADKKKLEIALDISPALGEMVSDARRVEQIFLNLLNNAVKFTDRGKISVSATREERTAGPNRVAGPALVLRVSDTGIGIKPEDLETLFKPFRQVDMGLTRAHEGTGLGLAICRRLADLLGGEITVESTWASGSEFRVTLPLLRRGGRSWVAPSS